MVMLLVDAGIGNKIYINCANIESMSVITSTKRETCIGRCQVNFMFGKKRGYIIDIPDEISDVYDIHKIFHSVFNDILIESQNDSYVVTIDLSSKEKIKDTLRDYVLRGEKI